MLELEIRDYESIVERIKDYDSSEKPLLHITHNDADAIGCAWVVKRAIPNVVTIFNPIGRIPEDEIIADIENGKYSGVFISDISPSVEFCHELEVQKDAGNINLLLGFDHHKTCKLGHEFLDWFYVTIDKERGTEENPVRVLVSAAEIVYHVWKKFISQEELFYNLIMSISRYDVWNWVNRKNDKSDYIIDTTITGMLYDRNNKYTEYLIEHEDFIPVLSKFYGTETLYKMYNREYFVSNLIDQNKQTYEVLKKQEAESVERTINATKFMYLDGHRVATFISTDLSANAAASEINKRFDVDMVIYAIPHIRQLAFRSEKVDVALYAVEKYGEEFAGGHASAAGARLTAEDFCNFLLRIYNTKEKLVQ